MNDADISSALERNTAAGAPSEATENNVPTVDQVDQDGNHKGWALRYVRKSKLKPIEGNMRTFACRQYFKLTESRVRTKPLTKIQ